jgi:hypothetical protein
LIDHINYLLLDENERRVFWAWLASKIQNPARSSYSVLLMTNGKQGVGRSVFARFLSKMLPGRVSLVAFETLIGKGSMSRSRKIGQGVQAKIGQLTVANGILGISGNSGIFWPEGSSDQSGGAQVDDPAPLRWSGNCAAKMFALAVIGFVA